MKKSLASLVFVLLSMILIIPARAVDGGYPSNATELDDWIVENLNDVFKAEESWENGFQAAMKSDKFKDLEWERRSIATAIDKSMTNINSLMDIGDAANYIKAALELLEYTKNNSVKAYQEFEKIEKVTSDDEINRLRANVKKNDTKTLQLISKVESAQDEYAKRNNFTVPKRPHKK
jgi:hypothetical protein